MIFIFDQIEIFRIPKIGFYFNLKINVSKINIILDMKTEHNREIAWFADPF